MVARSRMPDESSRFTDLSFDEVVSDPMAQIEHVYRRAGIELTGEARVAMATWRSRNAEEKLPKHRYSAEQFGLTNDQIRSEFADYTARFIPEERA